MSTWSQPFVATLNPNENFALWPAGGLGPLVAIVKNDGPGRVKIVTTADFIDSGRFGYLSNQQMTNLVADAAGAKIEVTFASPA